PSVDIKTVLSGLMDRLSNYAASSIEVLPEFIQCDRSETENDVSLNMNSVFGAEPDVVEVGGIEPKTLGSPAHATDTHSIKTNNVPDEVDYLDEIQDIDETLLVELDVVGDFSVNDLGSSSNDMKEDPRALEYDFEINRVADEESYSNDLGSVLNETKPDPHALEHDLETTHSVDEDSYYKEVGSTLPSFQKLIKDGPANGQSYVSTRVMGTHGYTAPEYMATGTDIAKIIRKEPKPDKNGHRNGKSTQETGSSKEAQGLQEGRITKLAIRVTLFNPRATIKGEMISRDQGTR
ncbi:hypothetical protein Tco_0019463, partial [Tanacetum coccineum]